LENALKRVMVNPSALSIMNGGKRRKERAEKAPCKVKVEEGGGGGRPILFPATTFGVRTP